MRAGMSTGQLGKLIGVAQSHMSRLENSRVAVTLDILHRIADALKVDPRELLEISDGGRATHFAAVRGDLRPKPSGKYWDEPPMK